MTKNHESKKELNNFLIDAISPDERWLVIFEDDGETGYLYFCSYNSDNQKYKILDHLWIYNQIKPAIQECNFVNIVWSHDSTKVCLVVDGECWGILDIKIKRKLAAPRKENSIKTIERIKWDNGLTRSDGDELRTI
ncbi:DUF2251 domain-containing protein [Paenibacillus puldeungensis]|uniref:DUF2251 domain-containing protein n=2 Tax=Paenibacillus puldeungensis TaxID=696536 RepID=A0ABW3S002_9BACL